MAEAVSSESRRWISENWAISAVARFISAAVTLSSVDWEATWPDVSWSVRKSPANRDID